jgi:hypothetical protein
MVAEKALQNPPLNVSLQLIWIQMVGEIADKFPKLLQNTV